MNGALTPTSNPGPDEPAGSDSSNALLETSALASSMAALLNWRNETCGRCGRSPAAGFAQINDVRYCHGDDQPITCYEQMLYADDLARPLGDDVDP